MKKFQNFQQVTGGKPRGPGAGGLGGGKNPYAAKPPGQQQHQNANANRNRPKNRNKGKGAGGGESSTDTTAASGATTGVAAANQPGVVSQFATDKPLDYFSGQLTGLGEITGTGPSTYENWLQNQFFNEQYSNYSKAMVDNPYEVSFDTYLADTYGPGNAGLDDAARNQFNSLTASQRGDFNNPFSGGTGRWQFWG